MASGDTLASFTPQMNEPPSSGFMTYNVRNGHLVLEATAGSTDTAIFVGIMPRNYGGGGITCYVTWATKTAIIGNVGFDVSFERDSGISGDDMTVDSWGTAQVIPATTVPVSTGLLKTTSIAVAAGAAGTASIAAGDNFRIRLRRLSSDSAAGNAQTLGVELKES